MFLFVISSIIEKDFTFIGQKNFKAYSPFSKRFLHRFINRKIPLNNFKFPNQPTIQNYSLQTIQKF